MPNNKKWVPVALSFLTSVLLSACSSSSEPEQAEEAADIYQSDFDLMDPWQGFNRSIYGFNDVIDTYALRPIAIGYDYVTPKVADRGLGNFFDNWEEPRNFVNNLLQGKFSESVISLLRFGFNTTAGLLGLVDVASQMGLEAKSEDFGQTLAVWGVPQGPYLVLPLLGPSSVRDAPAMIPDIYLNPSIYAPIQQEFRWGLTGLRIVRNRAKFLPVESEIFGDEYVFLRDFWLSKREYEVLDGAVEDDF